MAQIITAIELILTNYHGISRNTIRNTMKLIIHGLNIVPIIQRLLGRNCPCVAVFRNKLFFLHQQDTQRTQHFALRVTPSLRYCVRAHKLRRASAACRLMMGKRNSTSHMVLMMAGRQVEHDGDVADNHDSRHGLISAE